MHLYNLSQHFILLSYILTYIQHHNSPSVSTVALTFPLFSAWRLSQSTTGVIEAEWTARYTFYVHILDVTIWPFGRRCLWCCRISKTVIFPNSTVPHGHIVSWTCSYQVDVISKLCVVNFVKGRRQVKRLNASLSEHLFLRVCWRALEISTCSIST